jgi:hypothetical protein
LDHRYLKEKIRYVLIKDTLPNDYYNVFKNITRFSNFIKDTIEAELKNKYTESEIKTSFKYLTEEEFRAFKHKNIYKNFKKYGIPQGAGISSVCSNIYLLDFDEKNKNTLKNKMDYIEDIVMI